MTTATAPAPMMEHFDRGKAMTLNLDLTEEEFVREYREFRTDWNGLMGKPGPLPDSVWLLLAREQRRHLAAAPVASDDSNAKTPKGRGKGAAA